MEGSYEIQGVIGRSGLGTLYSARFVGDGGFSKLVALKMLDEGVTESDEVACRLRDEARVLGFLQHPAIVRADRLIRLAGRWTMVQDHVVGVDLESVLAQGPMPDGPALEVIAGVASALHAAYTSPGPDGAPLRLQHRDIKPATILVDPYGAPHVIDFGIARAFFSGREAHTRSFVVGSFEYMAPERLALEEGGPWSDIYSLGQVFFALLVGHGFGRSHPSERHHKAILDRVVEQLRARPDGVDEEIRELLLRMLALEPHERPDARSVERTAAGIARRLGQETLRSWAERVVDPMLAQRSASPRGGLVGRRLSEGDAVAPRSPGPPLADPGMVSPPRPAPPTEPALPRPEARPGLLPVPTLQAPGDDEATEIMTLSPAGGRLQRGLPVSTERETTETIDDPSESLRRRAGVVAHRGAADGPHAVDLESPSAVAVAPPEEPQDRPTQVDGCASSAPTGPVSPEEELADRPTILREPPSADHPATAAAWEFSDLGDLFASNPQDDVTAVTDLALDPGIADQEGPTVQRCLAESAEATAAIGDERPPGEAARFDPSRVIPVTIEEEEGPGAEDNDDFAPESSFDAMAPQAGDLGPEVVFPDPGPPPPPPPARGVVAPPSLLDEVTAHEVPLPATSPPPISDPPSEPMDLPVYGRPKHWTPPLRRTDGTRPQLDEWIPPSADTLSGRHPRPDLPPAPVAPSEQDETFIPPPPPPAPPLDDTLASRPEPEPTLERVTPLPPMAEGVLTEVVDEPTPSEPVLAESPAPGVAPPPRPTAAPSRKKRPSFLVIAVALLVLGGLLLAVMLIAAAVAWVVLGA